MSGDLWSQIFPNNKNKIVQEPQDSFYFIQCTNELQVLKSKTKISRTPKIAPDYEDNERTSAMQW